MDIVVRVEMGRQTSEQLSKALNLPSNLRARRRARRETRAERLQIDMQPHAQRRRASTQSDRLLRGRRVDHQAGAGQDALLMRLDDSPIDAGGRSEIVAVDDEILHRETCLPLGISSFSGMTGSYSSNQPLMSSSMSNPHSALSFHSASAGQMIRFASREYSAVSKSTLQSSADGKGQPAAFLSAPYTSRIQRRSLAGKRIRNVERS